MQVIGRKCDSKVWDESGPSNHVDGYGNLTQTKGIYTSNTGCFAVDGCHTIFVVL